jgi:hypothetical protein
VVCKITNIKKNTGFPEGKERKLHSMTFIKNNRWYWNRSCIILLIFMSISVENICSQTEKYKQLINEIDITRPISDKWAGELQIGGTFSNTPTEDKVFKTNIQRFGLLWAHYYASPRWKVSSSAGYYYNKDVPDIGQFESPEWRFAVQGIYYFHKIGYTLSTKMRGDVRFIRNEDGIYEDSYRYRQQVRFIKPINSKIMRQGVFYGLAYEEIFFRSISKSTGMKHFDRNILIIGAGYVITDDITVELAYSNEFIPRDNGDQICNAVNFTFVFNNLLSNLKKTFSGKQADPGQGN